ncbi:hypothetical protein [Methylobacterium dankookense]|uniref:Uncharacterized protein n=1 Tax=Methylobacterium dankookense TaxID=560405 RepID=A0A564FUV2_9HYPH|nr:hypothetical protein [Methylobacterium dankookense]GJD58815.1 hypothetical protein IFDJLNFL_4740 [Methylobacterium dankookense]VUF11568.1 hypothetical protein MTDSW087_01251 [Methylobacterium dankookense]
MAESGSLIITLALITLVIAVAFALVMRIRVAQKKGDPERSSIIHDHGGPPRQNMPGTEH